MKFWTRTKLLVIGTVALLLLALTAVRLHLDQIYPPYVSFEKIDDIRWVAHSEYRVPESPYVYWRNSFSGSPPALHKESDDQPGCRDRPTIWEEAWKIVNAAMDAPNPGKALKELSNLEVKRWIISSIFYGRIGYALDQYHEKAATCRWLIVILPPGSQIDGDTASAVKVEMSDTRQSTVECEATDWHEIRPDHSPCGYSTIELPELIQTEGQLAVRTHFFNWLHDDYRVDRCGRLSVTFRPPSGWTPPLPSGTPCKPPKPVLRKS